MEKIMNAATQANTETQTVEKKGNSSAKQQWETAVSDTIYVKEAQTVSKNLLKEFFAKRTPAKFTELNQQIAEAATNGDTDKIIELSQKLKDVKDAAKTNDKALNDFAAKHKFADVIQAYKDEFEELAYEFSLLALKESQKAITEFAGTKKGGRRSSTAAPKSDDEAKATRKKSVIEITTDKGEKIEMPVAQGLAAKKFKADEAVFEKLGFKVVVEGKDESLEPSVIELDNGSNVPATRNNIFNAITEQNAKMFKGYTATKVTAE